MNNDSGKAKAWGAVCKVLDEVSPGWASTGKKASGIECAIDAIKAMADSKIPVETLEIPAFIRPTDADCYRVLRTQGICDGMTHLRITDEVDAAIREALAAQTRQ